MRFRKLDILSTSFLSSVYVNILFKLAKTINPLVLYIPGSDVLYMGPRCSADHKQKLCAMLLVEYWKTFVLVGRLIVLLVF